MASVTKIVRECDLCHTSGDHVRTHTIRLDDKEVDIEICDRQFTKIETTLAPAMKAGRKLKHKKGGR